MSSNWEKFKKQQQAQQPTGKVAGKHIDGNYMCQFCNRMVSEATYFPAESVLEYECVEGHVSFIEKFFLA
jgi:hypothetical protein